MDKKFGISNVRYELITSSDPKFKEVQVLFDYQGHTEKYFIFLEDEGKKNYIKEAKRIFKRDLSEGKVVQGLKIISGIHNPLLVTSVSILGVAAITLGGLFTWKMLTTTGGGGDEPGPTPTIERTVNFNIPDCKMYYGDTEITSSGTKIKIPNIDPYYVKFSIKTNDDAYMKPGNVILNDGAYTDYFFYKETGDLHINLKSNVTITGTCDTYKSLKECSWAQIKAASEAGKAEDAFRIGDEKVVTLLENGEKQRFNHTVRIIDFNKDEDPNGNTLGITFEFKEVITKGTTAPTSAYTTTWNNVPGQSGNNCDYRASVLNKALNDETDDVDSIINRLPDDLKNAIKLVNKKVGVSTNEGTSFTAKSFESPNYPKLFPLAHDEIEINEEDNVTPEEGETYQYYKIYDSDPDRTKTIVDGDDKEDYWLRSPNTNGTPYAWYIRGNWPAGRTSSGGDVVDDAFTIAPAFCI